MHVLEDKVRKMKEDVHAYKEARVHRVEELPTLEHVLELELPATEVEALHCKSPTSQNLNMRR
jgi:hypothetical protein